MNEWYDIGAAVEPLCLWYEKNKRSMPWRDAATPYHVWLSEIMLQQTRIEAVKAYYDRFTKRLPDVRALADVSEDELLKLWEGLGYYNRARNLQKTAKLLVECYDSELPADYDKLMELPGIGSYTAGAIASIAYHVPAPAVDGNVMRVVMRYLNCPDDISKMKNRKKLERSVMQVIPTEHPGEFNQALMELGEVVCIPNGQPYCDKCPLQSSCKAYAMGTQMELPVKPAKKARRIEKRTILLFCCGDKVAIAKRPETGLLAGLWEFPSRDGYLTSTQVRHLGKELQMQIASIKAMESGKHIFSHVEWHMKGYQIFLKQIPSPDIVPELVWTHKMELEEIYSIPVAYHKFLHELNI